MSIRHKIGTKDGVETVTLTPLKAIKKKCLDCVCWQSKEVKLCEITLCPLWLFRSGKSGHKRPGAGQHLRKDASQGN
ncbi:MAG: hypothetical protein GY718_00065 [Lentisphaerae bacterium]|nr:hypothetical protein [Lentisphaerota bacterium]